MNADTQTILRQSGLPADLIAKMERAATATNDRCYQHPESPTGYVGRGRWCEHRVTSKQMLTLTQAASRLGVSPSTLRNQIHGKRLRATKVGRDWTVTEREVERYRAESLGKRLPK